MSSKPQRRPCLRFTQEQIDFVSKSEEKYKHIAQAFNATFERQITEKTVRAMRQRHGPYRGNHKWTAEQMTLVLNAEGTKGQIADAFKAKFNVEITHQNIRYLKTRYGPAAPLPDTDTGTHTRDQIRFVLDACEKLEHDNVPDRTKYAKVAEDYNTKFGTARKITDRGIRRIREQYGPALPFPCVHTDEQIQFILSENGKPAEVAKAYNARFNPKQKISVRAVKHLKDQHRSDLQLPSTSAEANVSRSDINVQEDPVTLPPISQLLAPRNQQSQQSGPVDQVYGRVGPSYPGAHAAAMPAANVQQAGYGSFNVNGFQQNVFHGPHQAIMQHTGLQLDVGFQQDQFRLNQFQQYSAQQAQQAQSTRNDFQQVTLEHSEASAAVGTAQAVGHGWGYEQQLEYVEPWAPWFDGHGQGYEPEWAR